MKTFTWARLLVLILSFSLLAPAWAQPAASSIKEEPTALAMTTDLFLVRPVMTVVTLASSMVWLVSSPFSLMGGNFKQATETLVYTPARSTFRRCLGCTRLGYNRDDAEPKVLESAAALKAKEDSASQCSASFNPRTRKRQDCES